MSMHASALYLSAVGNALKIFLQDCIFSDSITLT